MAKQPPPPPGLIPWKPGQSGNPSGRPKSNLTLQQLCRGMTEELVESLQEIARNKADKHRTKAIELLLAYGHGRPVQTANVRTIRRIEDLTDEELDALTADPEPNHDPKH